MPGPHRGRREDAQHLLRALPTLAPVRGKVTSRSGSGVPERTGPASVDVVIALS